MTRRAPNGRGAGQRAGPSAPGRPGHSTAGGARAATLGARLLALIALWAALLPSPARAADGGLLLGAVDPHQAPERASEIGVRWGRIVFDWSGIQRAGPESWDPAFLPDAFLDQELAAGRSLVGLVMSTPSWASGRSDPKAPPANLDLPFDHPENHWGRFVGQLAARYRGRIDAWVLWNEPDVWHDENGAQQWSGTVGEYYRLLKVGYLAIKAANPRATVALAGLTYWWDELYHREQYLSRLLKEAAADPSAPDHGWYFDVVVLQLYNDPRGLYEVPRAVRALLAAYGIAKPIWVAETNVVPWDDPAAPLPRAFYRATLDEQASFLIQAVAYARAAGVERLAVYKLRDDGALGPGEQAFGLFRSDAARSPRPSARAYQVAGQLLTDPAAVALEETAAVARVTLTGRARRVTVVWNRTGRPQVAPLAAGPAARLLDRFGEPADAAWVGPGLVRLDPATANTVPEFPEAYQIGGPPLLLVEPLGSVAAGLSRYRSAPR